MKRTRNNITWICMFCTLVSGCSSMKIVDPKAEDMQGEYADNIAFIITNDGMKYEFDQPAVLVKDAFVGIVKGNPVSIPLSNVSKVGVRGTNAEASLGAVGIILVAFAIVLIVAYLGSFKP